MRNKSKERENSFRLLTNARAEVASLYEQILAGRSAHSVLRAIAANNKAVAKYEAGVQSEAREAINRAMKAIQPGSDVHKVVLRNAADIYRAGHMRDVVARSQDRELAKRRERGELETPVSSTDTTVPCEASH